MSTCNTCSGATLNICVRTNEDYIDQFEFRSRTDAIDLTGWTIELQVRDGFTGSALVSVTTAAPTGNGSRITFLDAAAGQIEVFIDNLDLAALTIPAGANRKVYRYDMRFTDPTPVTSVLLSGEFLIQRGVTS